VFTYWGCRFIEENFERVWNDEYSRGQLLDDLRRFMHSLGYAQSAELDAQPDLRAAAPFTGVDDSAPWVTARPPARVWSRHGTDRRRPVSPS
jgi:hypothetical protein